MDPSKIIVSVVGFFLIFLIIWFFFFSKKTGKKAEETESGIQEAMIVVKGGYTPDVIVVKKGKPVRLNFHRKETASCSERVVIPEFGKSALLPTNEVVSVEFTPDKEGEYGFSCQIGMFKGKIIVE